MTTPYRYRPCLRGARGLYDVPMFFASSFFVAVYYVDTGVVGILLTFGAWTDVRDEAGRTPVPRVGAKKLPDKEMRMLKGERDPPTLKVRQRKEIRDQRRMRRRRRRRRRRRMMMMMMIHDDG